MSRNSVRGRALLNRSSKIIPPDGLSYPLMRVELAKINTPDIAWMGEIEVLGELPWHRGEERAVIVRVMSDELSEEMESNPAELLLKRGPETIGVFLPEESQ